MSKKKNEVRIETRKDEVKYTTSDTKRMLGKFLVHHLKRKWNEAFTDEDTGEVVNIERNEIILEAGTYLGKEELATISFYIQEGSVTEVEVSNQRRMAYESSYNGLHPFIAQVFLDKKKKFLLKAQSIDQAMEIVKDFTELNNKGQFRITMIKEFDFCPIIVDRLSVTPLDEVEQIIIDNSELYLEEEINKILGENRDEEPESKFYSITARVCYSSSEDTEDKEELKQSFIVQTYTAERGMMLINKYINDEQDRLEKECKEKDRGFLRKIIHAYIEESSIIPINQYIPEEFSLAYVEE